MSDAAAGWAPYPGAPIGSRSLPPLGPDDDARHEQVVGVGALCEFKSPRLQRDESSQSFSVSEFVLLENGRRILLHCDRGFTLGASRSPGAAAARDVRGGLTIETLRENVLHVVRPETLDGEPPQEDHPWEWLSELARQRGLQVSAGDMRVLRYDVVVADEVQHWLQEG